VSVATRRPEEIRSSIVEARRELADTMEELRTRMHAMTDWRRQLNEHRVAAVAVAAAVGFVVGRRIIRRRRG
jgi:ElaB/YqjD/DUF883 family membrane-anchored ribosome-binding protein